MLINGKRDRISLAGLFLTDITDTRNKELVSFRPSSERGTNKKQQGEKNDDDILEQEMQLIEDAICTEPDDQTAWWYHKLLL